MGVDLKEI